MGKEQYYKRLKFIIQNDDALYAIFVRICRHFNRRGKIQDKLTVSSISMNVKQQLCYAFNFESFKTNYIDLKLFFDSMSFSISEKEKWIDNIFEYTGIEKKSIHEIELEKEKKYKLILKRLIIQYPKLSTVIDYIRDNKMLEKETEESLNQALTIITALRTNTQFIDFSQLGATELSDSKIIREKTSLFTLVFKILLSELDEFELDKYSKNPKALYEKYKVISNPTAIKVSVFGPFVYYKKGICFDYIKKLWEVGESAILSLDNLEGIDSVRLDDDVKVLTCENESPFNSLIRKSEHYAVIFTSGYPNSAVKKLLILLKNKYEGILHWGDSDFDGLRIAEIINNITTVKLWRCTIDDSKTYNERLKPVDDNKKSKIKKFLNNKPDFIFRKELEYSLKNGWLEQEDWNK